LKITLSNLNHSEHLEAQTNLAKTHPQFFFRVQIKHLHMNVTSTTAKVVAEVMAV